MLVIALVGEVAQLHGQPGGLSEGADLAEAPAELGVGGDEAGGGVSVPLENFGCNTVLLGDRAQLRAPPEATFGRLADAPSVSSGAGIWNRGSSSWWFSPRSQVKPASATKAPTGTLALPSIP